MVEWVPVGDEKHFVRVVALLAVFARGALGSPGDVIDVAEGMSD